MKFASRLSVVFATALVIVNCAAPAFGGILSVPQKYQEMDQWCWAACSQANLAFYGVAKSQTTIAQYGTAGANVPNYLYGGDSSHNGVDMVLAYFGGIATTPFASAFSLAALTGEINASRPPIIRWGWDNGGGHVVVAYGTDSSTVYIMDPWYGPTVNTYNWVCRGSSHTWTHTLAMKSRPTPTPNPNAGYAYTYAYYGYLYTSTAYASYSASDPNGFLYAAYSYANYAQYYAYYAYYYDAIYGSDCGYASYTAQCAQQANIYASYAYTYGTKDAYSYYGAINEYYAYLYANLLATGQR